MKTKVFKFALNGVERVIDHKSDAVIGEPDETPFVMWADANHAPDIHLVFATNASEAIELFLEHRPRLFSIEPEDVADYVPDEHPAHRIADSLEKHYALAAAALEGGKLRQVNHWDESEKRYVALLCDIESMQMVQLQKLTVEMTYDVF